MLVVSDFSRRELCRWSRLLSLPPAFWSTVIRRICRRFGAFAAEVLPAVPTVRARPNFAAGVGGPLMADLDLTTYPRLEPKPSTRDPDISGLEFDRPGTGWPGGYQVDASRLVSPGIVASLTTSLPPALERSLAQESVADLGHSHRATERTRFLKQLQPLPSGELEVRAWLTHCGSLDCEPPGVRTGWGPQHPPLAPRLLDAIESALDVMQRMRPVVVEALLAAEPSEGESWLNEKVWL